MRKPKGRSYDRNNKPNMQMTEVEPLTTNQMLMMNSQNHVVASGSAGTGKTFLATYMAFRDIFEYEKYDKIKFVRSVVPTREMGFLKGDDREKSAVYETPYKGIVNELFKRGDAYEILKLKGNIDFVTTSFLRGTTINNCAIIVDECQNMSYHELDTVITRAGHNCRLFFCGDMFQADLRANGIEKFFEVLSRMNEFSFTEFQIADIVRGPLVKSYLTEKYALHGNRHVS